MFWNRESVSNSIGRNQSDRRASPHTGRFPASVADSLWNTLSEEQKEQIEAVVLDRGTTFLTSTEAHVPQAEIVHDRFHIARHPGEAVDRVSIERRRIVVLC
ncbi:MAG: transposase [Planctomycetes bacterium]|nr:transposase [Planctomycetota bacterium]